MKLFNGTAILMGLVLTLTIAGCSSSSDSGTITPVVPLDVLPGIYTGTITPDGDVPTDITTLITSDGRFAIIPDTNEGALGTVANGVLTGTIYSTSIIPLVATVTSINAGTVSGTYVATLGPGVVETGTFTLTADAALYSRGAALAKLEGIWNNAGDTISWVIQADGSFTATFPAPCTASGNFTTIDVANNEYSLSVTTTNCSVNDTFSGVGALGDDLAANDNRQLSFVFGDTSTGSTLTLIKK